MRNYALEAALKQAVARVCSDNGLEAAGATRGTRCKMKMRRVMVISVHEARLRHSAHWTRRRGGMSSAYATS